jgi:hypothetical protein
MSSASRRLDTPPKTYMYSSELHRGVNDLISINQTLFAPALNGCVISIVFFVWPR